MILLEADKKLMKTSLPQGQRIIGENDVKKKFRRVVSGLDPVAGQAPWQGLFFSSFY